MISNTIKEALWLNSIVGELLGKNIKATLMCDSQSAIHLVKNQAHHKRTKYIDVRFLLLGRYLRERK